MMGDLEVLEERIKCIERKLAEDEEVRAKALSLASENLSLRLTNEFATKLMLTDENTKTIVALEAKYETIESKFRAVLIVILFALFALIGDIVVRTIPHFTK